MYEFLTIKDKKQYTKCYFVNINRVNLKRETKNKFSSVQIVETADWFDKLFVQRIKIPIYSLKTITIIRNMLKHTSKVVGSI